jgi:hypothetical protein
MEHSENGSSTIYPKSTPEYRAQGRLAAIKQFFFMLIRQIGIFVLGIIVGMGLVLKNPPENMVMIKKIEVLEKDKKTLEKTIENSNSVPKSSYQID